MKSLRLRQGLTVGIALAVALITGVSSSAHAAASVNGDAQFHPSGTLSITEVSATGTSLQLTAVTIDDVTPQELTYTLSKEKTQNWYLAALAGGIPAVISLCATSAPGWLKVHCATLGSIAVALLVANPPNGRCLQAFAKLGWPPVGARYVTCPSLALSTDARFGLPA
ncbi:hypothetical protein ABZ345_44710 [Lentzea sp. NPDC005914]|uniref:hypothetical protein n=1 Tax=Lentzea sp. NPDC005914 TaxID=3154572 RepID=UPI0033F4FA96